MRGGLRRVDATRAAIDIRRFTYAGAPFALLCSSDTGVAARAAIGVIGLQIRARGRCSARHIG